MRCTQCHMGNTKLIRRTVELVVRDGVVKDADMRDLWLCYSCGDTFRPAVSRIQKWERQSPFKEPRTSVPKKWIVDAVWDFPEQ